MNNLQLAQKAILDLEYDLNRSLNQAEYLFGLEAEETKHIRQSWYKVVKLLPEYGLSDQDTYTMMKVGE